MSSSTGRKVIRILRESQFAPTFESEAVAALYVQGYIGRAERILEGLPLDDQPVIDEWGLTRGTNHDGWTIEHTRENLNTIYELQESKLLHGKER